MPGTAHALTHALNLGDVTVKTTAGNVTMLNEGAVVVNKTSGAATQVTLPAHAGQDGNYAIRWVVDGKGDAATNNITVAAASGDTILGASTYVISENYGCACFLLQGTDWKLVGQSLPVSAAELGVLNGVTPGTAAASKALVLDSASSVATINSLTTTTALVTNAAVSGTFALSGVASLNAAGSAIGNATALTGTVNVVAGADDAKGVILPATVAGQVVVVYSSQATNGLKVYPPVNSSINGGTANSAVVIEGKTLALFVGTNATNWASIFTVNT